MGCADSTILEAGGQPQRKSGRLARKPNICFRESDSEAEIEADEQKKRGLHAGIGQLGDGRQGLTVQGDQTRKRSLRLSGKPIVNFHESDSDYGNTPKKRKLDSVDEAWMMSKEGSVASTQSELIDDASLDVSASPRSHSRGKSTRRAAKVALRRVQAIHRTNSASLSPSVRVVESVTKESDPVLDEAARTFDQRKNTYLKPLPLSDDRITIDPFNVAFYAEEGATDVWASALSSSRFNGPRRHPPFRELHRLTDPEKHDVSDWAENIRWAKEQHRHYGSVWTEYDHSLETITHHRIEKLWVSEEMITRNRLPS